MSTCSDCGETAELRPYGIKGALICFECAFKTPSAKSNTEQQFSTQLNACQKGSCIGTNAGPFPLEYLLGTGRPL